MNPDGSIVPAEQAEPGAIPIEDRPTAEKLALFNRRARQAFWSARRHGKSEAEAFIAAERTLPR